MPQLVANAKAAIDAVDELGYIDRNKVAVGGHSYGAFMTANLLSHSDLFAAGIDATFSALFFLPLGKLCARIDGVGHARHSVFGILDRRRSRTQSL